MAISFPLDRDAFLGALRVKSMNLILDEAGQNSGLGGGAILRDKLGPTLWQGTVTLHRGTPSQVRADDALINLVNQTGASFLAWDKANPGPALDPLGKFLGSATVAIKSVAVDGTALALKGLPAGFRLKLGDRFGVPSQQALFEVSEPQVIVDTNGETPEFAVRAAVEPGVVADLSVDMVKPYCTAIIVPGTARFGNSSRGRTSGASFQFIQTEV